MDVWRPGKSSFSDQISVIGTDAKDIEVLPKANLDGSGVCAVIDAIVVTIPENRLDLTRCCRHGVSQPADFQGTASRYADHLVWHSALYGIVYRELGSWACAVPYSKQEIAIFYYLDVSHQRSLPSIFIIIRKKLHYRNVILQSIFLCISVHTFGSPTNYRVGDKRE